MLAANYVISMIVAANSGDICFGRLIAWQARNVNRRLHIIRRWTVGLCLSTFQPFAVTKTTRWYGVCLQRYEHALWRTKLGHMYVGLTRRSCWRYKVVKLRFQSFFSETIRAKARWSAYIRPRLTNGHQQPIQPGGQGQQLGQLTENMFVFVAFASTRGPYLTPQVLRAEHVS